MKSSRILNSASLLGLPLFAGAALAVTGCSVSVGNSPTTSTGTGSNATVGTQSSAGATTPGASGTGTGTSTDTSGTNAPGNLGKCNRAATPTTTVDADIQQDTVWQGVVLLNKKIRVSGTTKLTIKPGTTILAKPGAGLELGYLSSSTTLVANGNAQQPIHFCGQTASAGSWEGITVQSSSTSLNSLAYVSIEDAGIDQGAAVTLAAATKVNSVTVKGSKGDGVRASQFTAGSDKLSVSGSKAPVRLTSAKAFTNFPTGGVLKGNTKDFVYIDFNLIEEDVTIRKVDVPYLQVQDLRHQAQAVWTIEAGVQYKLAADREIQAGYLSNKTSLMWKGDAANPIVFSGENVQPGSWKGISINPATATNSKLSHVKLQHAGGNNMPSLRIAAPIALNDVTIEDGVKGLMIHSVGVAAGSSKVNVNRVKGHPVELEAQALLSMPAGGTFTGNEKNSIKVDAAGGKLEKGGTIPAMAIPYHIVGSLKTQTGEAITVGAGTTFEMAADSSIEFGYLSSTGALNLVGTQAKPIVFKGATNTAGSWKNLRIHSGVASTSKFDYVQISDGGQGSTGLLELDRAISVKNSKFSNSLGWGIRHASGDTTDYATSNTFEKNAKGTVSAK